MAPPGSGQPCHEDQTFPWILDHMHSYPGGYEIPLRTMYTLNTSPRAQPMTPQPSRPQSPSFQEQPGSPATSGSDWPVVEDAYAGAHAAAVQFKSSLMDQIACLPTQPCSLPPDFIISFARKCFPKSINEVNFPQALTGLDYLRDLDNRRRREIVAALRRLGINRASTDWGRAQRAMRHPFVTRWIKSLEEKELHVENLYSHCYIGLRRWILINEMYTAPFNKANCLAMLNTLFPPSPTVAPTPQLSIDILTRQRNGYWRFIRSVEKNGRRTLDPFMSPDQAQTDEACWSNISQSVDAYLKESKTFIEECSRVTGMESFTPDEEAEAAFNSPVDSPVKSPTQSGTRSHQRGTPKKGNTSISQDKSSNTSNLSDASKLSDSSTTSDKSNWSSDTTASRETTATSISAQSSVDPDQARHRKNVDSGISLSVTDERPISAGSKDSGYHSPGSRPLPPLPVKTASKFGRLTRSLRKMNDRRRAAGVIEIDEEPQPLKSRPTDRFAGPRKMQPTEVFGGRKMSNPLVATTIDMYPERQASLAGALQQGPSLSPGFWRPRSPQYYNQYSTPNLKV